MTNESDEPCGGATKIFGPNSSASPSAFSNVLLSVTAFHECNSAPKTQPQEHMAKNKARWTARGYGSRQEQEGLIQNRLSVTVCNPKLLKFDCLQPKWLEIDCLQPKNT